MVVWLEGGCLAGGSACPGQSRRFLDAEEGGHLGTSGFRSIPTSTFLGPIKVGDAIPSVVVFEGEPETR